MKHVLNVQQESIRAVLAPQMHQHAGRVLLGRIHRHWGNLRAQSALPGSTCKQMGMMQSRIVSRAKQESIQLNREGRQKRHVSGVQLVNLRKLAAVWLPTVHAFSIRNEDTLQTGTSVSATADTLGQSAS